jgi:hypothetical protein
MASSTIPIEENPPAASLEKKSSRDDNVIICHEVMTTGVNVAEVRKKCAATPNRSISSALLPSASAEQPPSVDQTDNLEGGHESWNDMLYQLLLYKVRKGDVNIHENDSRYRPLYNWIQTQREHYSLYREDDTSTTLLNADRVAVLESIDTQCTARGEIVWRKYFDALVAYKNEHGDVRVPRNYEAAPKLGEWITDQRKQFKARLEGKPTTMTTERMAKLDQLGFVWQFRDRMDWNERYEKLLEYKKEVSYKIMYARGGGKFDHGL